MRTAATGARRVALLVVVGVLGGVLSGFFGVGGGTVMVPLLIWLMGMDQRRAAATSLVAIVPTAVVGAVTYAAGGHVAIMAGVLLSAGAIGGALLGSRLLRRLPLGVLRWMFIGLLGFAAVETLLEIPSRDASISVTPTSGAMLLLVGVLMGVASGLFGVGGGIVAVPILIAGFGSSDLLAKGTSLLAMIPTALTGSVVNVRAGLVTAADGLVAGAAAAVASLVGVALAYVVSPFTSGLLFFALMVVTMSQLAYRAVTLRGTDD